MPDEVDFAVVCRLLVNGPQKSKCRHLLDPLPPGIIESVPNRLLDKLATRILSLKKDARCLHRCFRLPLERAERPLARPVDTRRGKVSPRFCRLVSYILHPLQGLIDLDTLQIIPFCLCSG